MRVTIQGTVDDVTAIEKDGKKFTQVFLNQQGEQQKTKVKVYDSTPIGSLGSDQIFEGRLFAGEMNGNKWAFIKVG